ncbi:tautomerase family protein [Aphanizomenon sp. CS-733/32]|jgi:phenylpyruvate tautomerase PptA (4-oxalocrotonate tautomerase family)|uniref:tautomerase family protein n=1 Tax=Nostocales TaxID=1161 RepID=UPI00232D3DA7|nr:tautomerase family protein [Aphanizomenon sp. CS-733/32]MDB9308203.1 tautomerase family protein [Aphanizomenon sp. CS-733/32]MDB9458716.1 tautomerase family protein [Dolichospermum circinale CS-545/17]
MPVTLIELSQSINLEDKQQMVTFVHTTMVEVLKIPESDRLVRVIEYDSNNFYPPINASDKYALITISMFPGRSLESKKLLYQKLCQGLETFGFSPTDTRIIINEIPAENWGLRGGISGDELL